MCQYCDGTHPDTELCKIDFSQDVTPYHPDSNFAVALFSYLPNGKGFIELHVDANDAYSTHYSQVSYCPFCGRKLK
jgi:hypothetical protein